MISLQKQFRQLVFGGIGRPMFISPVQSSQYTCHNRSMSNIKVALAYVLTLENFFWGPWMNLPWLLTCFRFLNNELWIAEYWDIAVGSNELAWTTTLARSGYPLIFNRTVQSCARVASGCYSLVQGLLYLFLFPIYPSRSKLQPSSRQMKSSFVLFLKTGHVNSHQGTPVDSSHCFQTQFLTKFQNQLFYSGCM